MVYGGEGPYQKLLLNLKPSTTSDLTQNSTSFTDTAKNMTHHTSDKAFLHTVGTYPTKIYDVTFQLQGVYYT